MTHTRIFPVTIDYSNNIEEMAQAGEYKWSNEEINPNKFPIMGEGEKKVKLRLKYFGKHHSYEDEDIVRDIKHNGWRPAKVEELIAFGVKYPDLVKNKYFYNYGCI